MIVLLPIANILVGPEFGGDEGRYSSTLEADFIQ